MTGLFPMHEALFFNAETRTANDGSTYTEWATSLFEFEFCESCGGDTEDHTPLLVFGNWVAMCKLEEEEEA